MEFYRDDDTLNWESVTAMEQCSFNAFRELNGENSRLPVPRGTLREVVWIIGEFLR